MENITSTSAIQRMNSSRSPDEIPHTTINVGFEARNVVIGSLGIIVNGVAFFVVLASSKVKQCRKMMLLNLIISDIINTICMIIYGLEFSTQISGGKGCMPMIYFLMTSLLNSEVICFQLSIVNFVAVFKPFRYNELVSLKNTGITVAMAWVTTGGLMFWWLGTSFPSGLTCAPIVVVPRYGLIGIGTIQLLTTFGVLVLNVAAVAKLKNLSKNISGGSKGNDKTLDPKRLQRERKAMKDQRNVFVRVLEICTKSKKNRVEPFDTSATRTSACVPATSMIWMGEINQEASSSRDPEAESKSRNVDLLPVYYPQTSGGQSDDQSNSDANSPERPQLVKIGVISPRITVTVPTKDKIVKTLSVLTSYSCLITLPVAIYLICIVEGAIEDPETMLASPLGIFVSSCPVVKACVNPFFYVLNFVNWRTICNALNGRPQSYA